MTNAADAAIVDEQYLDVTWDVGRLFLSFGISAVGSLTGKPVPASLTFAAKQENRADLTPNSPIPCRCSSGAYG